MFDRLGNKSLFTFEMPALKDIGVEFLSMKLEENLSEPESLQIVLRAVDGIQANDWVNQSFHLSWGAQDTAQYFHGKVYGFNLVPEAGGFTQYTLHCSSVLNDLKLIHQSEHTLNKPLTELIKQVIQRASLPYQGIVFHLSQKDPVREFSYQNNESSLSYLQRLCHEFGWFFRSEHSPDGVVFHVYDHAHFITTVPDPVPFILQSQGAKSQPSVYDILSEGQLVISKHVYQAQDPYKPSALLKSDTVLQNTPKTGERTRTIETATTQEDLDCLSTRSVEQENVEALQLRAHSDRMDMRAGMAFSLSGHPDTSLNQSYLVLSVIHEVDETGTAERYKNTLQLLPRTVSYRPAYQPSAHQITHLSMARVFSSDETPHLTDRGEYILQSAYSGEHTHPVRLTTPFAGAEYGLHFPLHNDTQVLVAHLNGHPDKPFILGALFNDEHNNVVTSENATQNRLVTRKGNTLLMDDTDAKNQIFIHTPLQKNRVLLDSTEEAQKIELISEEGEMVVNISQSSQVTTQDHHALEAGESITVTAQQDCRFASDEANMQCDAAQDIKHTSGQDMNWHADMDMIVRVDGAMESTIQQGMRTDIIEGNYTLAIQAGQLKHEAKNNLQFSTSQGDIVLKTAGASVAFQANGDIVFDAKNIILKASNIDIHNAESTLEN